MTVRRNLKKVSVSTAQVQARMWVANGKSLTLRSIIHHPVNGELDTHAQASVLEIWKSETPIYQPCAINETTSQMYQGLGKRILDSALTASEHKFVIVESAF
jgi:hypothetical protein